MNLYHIEFDGQNYWVEAPTYGEAIRLWKEHVAKLWGGDYQENDEPDSCHKVHDEPVIRDLTHVGDGEEDDNPEEELNR